MTLKLINLQDALKDMETQKWDSMNDYNTALYVVKKACLEEQPASTGITGWICPICGRALSPWTSSCNCNQKWEVTC